MVKRGRESLESNMDIIEDALLESNILHVDETSLRINGKLACQFFISFSCFLSLTSAVSIQTYNVVKQATELPILHL